MGLALLYLLSVNGASAGDFQEMLSSVSVPKCDYKWFSSRSKDEKPATRSKTAAGTPNCFDSPAVISNSAQITDPARAAALVVIDEYFDELISQYPESTRTLLREIYYDQKHISVSETDLGFESDATGSVMKYANWQMDKTHDQPARWTVTVDADVRRSPILFRLNLIHEVAIHLGQAHQRAQKVGLVEFAKEGGGAFRKVTELSAAVAENQLLQWLPFEVFAADVKAAVRDKVKSDFILADYYARRERKLDQVLTLSHRGNDDGIIKSNMSLFKQRCK